MSELLQINDLTYQTDNTLILDRISLVAHPGEYLAVIGQNGAGKSTLIKCIAGILDGWSGMIQVRGQNIATMDAHERARIISYVPQGGVGPTPFSVGEFMLLSRYPYYRHRQPAAADHTAVEEAMEQVDMTAFYKRRMNTLSGGERQMVGIAAALAQHPEVILLDEPVTFLDYRHAIRVHQVMAEARKQRSLAVISVLHNVHDAGHYADRFLALKAGGALHSGESAQLMKDMTLLAEIYDVPFIRLSDTKHNRSFPVVETC